MIGKLATKIAAASNDVGGKLSADKRNQDQKYDYVSADKILAVCGQALASQGVVVFPGITKSEVVMTERTGKSSRYDATIELGITVTDGETEYACAWIGLGSDYMTPDKALYKAVTSGHKYFLMKLLNVGAGNEDGEHEAHEQSRQRRDQPRQQPQPVQSTQPKPQPTNGQAKRIPDGDIVTPTGRVFIAAEDREPANDPPGFETWADWSKPEHAIQWGLSQGVFDHQRHAENAYAKVKAECKPAKASDMWQCWYADVMRRIAEKAQADQPPADDDGWAEIEVNGVEVPLFS